MTTQSGTKISIYVEDNNIKFGIKFSGNILEISLTTDEAQKLIHGLEGLIFQIEEDMQHYNLKDTLKTWRQQTT